MRLSVRCLISLLALLVVLPLSAQRIENVKATVVGEKVIITYDILGASEGQRFKLQLFSSHDNFSTSLSLVKGDVGANNTLLPGRGKRIEWDAKTALQNFNGEVTFEVKGDVVSPVLSPSPSVSQSPPATSSSSLALVSPAIGASVKRGKTIDIRWTGAVAGEMVKLELIKDGVTQSQIGRAPNSGSFSWTVPKSVSKGSGYQVRLTRNANTVMSNPFTIKNKMSPLVIALPVLAVGGGAYFLLQPKDEEGGNGGPNPVSSGLPLPPEPN